MTDRLAEIVVEKLRLAGFVPDGETRMETVRTWTHETPVYGGIGGKLSTFGGRQRFACGDVRVTVGARTVAKWRKTGPGIGGVSDMQTMTTREAAESEAFP